MSIQCIDPIADARWGEFVAAREDSSIFHTAEWADALRQTYGYRPVAFVQPQGDSLIAGLLCCEVKSLWTGKRLVSLPFSDHCRLLADGPGQTAALLAAAARHAQRRNWKYVQVSLPDAQPLRFEAGGFSTWRRYHLHKLDLRPGLEKVFSRLHPSCIRRNIRRAEKAGLECRQGRSDDLVEGFYRLQVMTRRRHGLPPQPRAWFRNLVRFLGDRLLIRLACCAGRPVASILTLRHRKTEIYKYGCSDQRFHSLGAMPWLLWQAVREAVGQGAAEFDMGRSDLGNAGLTLFKDRWGAARSTLACLRWSRNRKEARSLLGGLEERLASGLFARLPDPLLEFSGRILYKHFG